MATKLRESSKGLKTVILTLVLLNTLVWLVVMAQELYRGKVLPGLGEAGLNLGGKPVAVAEQELSDHLDSLLDTAVSVHAGDAAFTYTARQLGMEVSRPAVAHRVIELTRPQAWLARALNWQAKAAHTGGLWTLNVPTFETVLSEIGSRVDVAPRNLSLDWTEGKLVEVPAQTGRRITAETATQLAQSALTRSIPASISLPIEAVPPQLTSPEQIARAKEKLLTLLASPITLTADGKTLVLTPQDTFQLLSFGVENNELTFELSEELAVKKLDGLAKKVYRAAITRQLAANGAVLVEGQDGIKLDTAKSLDILKQSIADGKAQTMALATAVVSRKTSQDSGDFYDLNRTDGKYIDISLSKQRLAIIENNQLVGQFAVSTGKWSTPTPQGEFQILNHISNAWSKRYGLYMPFWMGIKNEGAGYEGYGIHQLPYWPNGYVEGTAHLGSPASHGCIRLGPGDAETVYNWAPNGTKVFIHR